MRQHYISEIENGRWNITLDTNGDTGQLRQQRRPHPAPPTTQTTLSPLDQREEPAGHHAASLVLRPVALCTSFVALKSDTDTRGRRTTCADLAQTRRLVTINRSSRGGHGERGPGVEMLLTRDRVPHTFYAFNVAAKAASVLPRACHDSMTTKYRKRHTPEFN